MKIFRPVREERLCRRWRVWLDGQDHEHTCEPYICQLAYITHYFVPTLFYLQALHPCICIWEAGFFFLVTWHTFTGSKPGPYFTLRPRPSQHWCEGWQGKHCVLRKEMYTRWPVQNEFLALLLGFNKMLQYDESFREHQHGASPSLLGLTSWLGEAGWQITGTQVSKFTGEFFFFT